MKSLKFSKSFFSTKKKNAEKAQKKVDKPTKQSRIVALICMNALWKLINFENFNVEKNTVNAITLS